eukprot:1134220-Pelagomonas_calceolata.AAC.4
MGALPPNMLRCWLTARLPALVWSCSLDGTPLFDPAPLMARRCSILFPSWHTAVGYRRQRHPASSRGGPVSLMEIQVPLTSSSRDEAALNCDSEAALEWQKQGSSCDRGGGCWVHAVGSVGGFVKSRARDRRKKAEGCLFKHAEASQCLIGPMSAHHAREGATLKGDFA